MGYLNPVKQRAYCRKWMAERRAAWFAANGPCRHCGSSERLELDHIDPSTKVTHAVWSWTEERRNAELAKCQPLCHACHLEKTRQQLRRPITHGRTGYKRGCRCDACRVATVDYNRTWVKVSGSPSAIRSRALGPRLVSCVDCGLSISYLGAGRPPIYCSACKSARVIAQRAS